METLMEIGQIVNTYGIKGFVKVQPFTDNIRRFEDLKQIYLQLKKGLETFEIEEILKYIEAINNYILNNKLGE